MAAVPAGMGFGSALKGATSSAGPQLAQQLGLGQLGQGNQSQAPSLPPAPPPTPGFQIQPVVSTGSSAAPLSFSGGSATASPANNMNPQLMRLIQLMNSMGMRG